MPNNTNSTISPREPISSPEKAADTKKANKDALEAFNQKYDRDDDERGVRRLRRRQAKLNQILLTARIVAEESKKAQARRSKWKLANGGPIGLLGFGMTTVLLNLHNTGVFSLYSVIPAMGICFGGLAQLAAGLLEFCRGNTFGYVAFVSYGAFWLSLVCVWMLPNQSFGIPSEIVASSEYFVGVYLIIWGIFSFMMLCCTLRMNLAIFTVFLTVVILFLLLGIGNMTGSKRTIKAAGYEGIVCGCTALYLAFAEVLNEVWDRTILPVVPMTQLLGWFGCGGGDSVKEEKESDKASSAAASSKGASQKQKDGKKEGDNASEL